MTVTYFMELGETIGIPFPFNWYTFRRWTGNEANSRPFTPGIEMNSGDFASAEWNRILNHSGSHTFERYYNDHLIHQDLQSVDLLRPPQTELLWEAAQMHRKGGPDAPQDLTDEQRCTLCGPYLTSLCHERAALHLQMRFVGKSISSAKGTEIYQHFSELGKAINRRRQELRRKGKAQVRKTYFDAIPATELDKQIDAMIGVESSNLDDVEFKNDWTPSTPSFCFPEHERTADAFFGPTVETLTGDEALSRRIQVIHDLSLFVVFESRPNVGRDWIGVNLKRRSNWMRSPSTPTTH